jgi:hypothetical protein
MATLSQPPPPRQQAPSRYPALDQWRREFRSGLRGKTDFDALWRAACAQRSAQEAIEDRLPDIAETFLAEARRLWSLPAEPSPTSLVVAPGAGWPQAARRPWR